jgi:hypothetical protein
MSLHFNRRALSQPIVRAPRNDIGAALSLFTGRSVLWSGTRQQLLGFAAAGATYAIGHAIGVAVTG